jgi:hypothetical protein
LLAALKEWNMQGLRQQQQQVWVQSSSQTC